MASTSSDGSSYNSVASIAFKNFTASTADGGTILIFESPAASSSYTAGSGISISGDVISNTKQMATVTLDGVPYTTVSNLVFNGFTTSNSGPTLTLQAPTSSGSTSYTAGTAIGISGNTINNTQPAPAIKVGSYTWQPSSISSLEFSTVQ